ncbi:MAG: hypothetical protein HYV24_12900 [Deltaproteobacteria bacterium]|nr:hypothetical protein [Deltaproteobacteria bacterium]
MKAMTGIRDLMPRISSMRIRPLVAVLAVIASFYLYKYHKYIEGRIGERMREYSDAAVLLEKSAGLQGRESEVRARFDELEKGLVRSSSAAKAASLIEGSFREAASKRGVELVSKRRLPSVPENGYVRVPIEFQARGRTGVLKDLLYDIYASKEMSGVSSIKIRRIDDRGTIDAVFIVDGMIKAGDKVEADD